MLWETLRGFEDDLCFSWNRSAVFGNADDSDLLTENRIRKRNGSTVEAERWQKSGLEDVELR
jgi:hypothetical protein